MRFVIFTIYAILFVPLTVLVLYLGSTVIGQHYGHPGWGLTLILAHPLSGAILMAYALKDCRLADTKTN